jgi:hypothetical protein
MPTGITSIPVTLHPALAAVVNVVPIPAKGSKTLNSVGEAGLYKFIM